jgi:hypothetical protein
MRKHMMHLKRRRPSLPVQNRLLHTEIRHPSLPIQKGHLHPQNHHRSLPTQISILRQHPKSNSNAPPPSLHSTANPYPTKQTSSLFSPPTLPNSVRSQPCLLNSGRQSTFTSSPPASCCPNRALSYARGPDLYTSSSPRSYTFRAQYASKPRGCTTPSRPSPS